VKHDEASTAVAASAKEKNSGESVRRMPAHWRERLEFARADPPANGAAAWSRAVLKLLRDEPMPVTAIAKKRGQI